jgi:hypothetical protein
VCHCIARRGDSCVGPMTTNDDVRRSLFGCHVADSDVAPEFISRRGNRGGGGGFVQAYL